MVWRRRIRFRYFANLTGLSMSLTPDASTLAVGLRGKAWVLKDDGTSYSQVGNELLVQTEGKKEELL